MTNDKQRERLVESIQASVNGCARNWAEVIADYLLANGVIAPPCKVGDKIYWINHITKEIETDIVIAIHQYEDGLSIATNTIGRKSTTTFSLNRFLEIMSFTKEEAEAKLKEGVQG